ncbi:uncharacterized protein EI90DRAFT_3014731 [Cantharellus anzutake]|uniref:uncharacterized protein n=1 Tax=Cantharellus anzutake TaxID=1750568 RepID=UPI0019058FC2|nr:uncharacterized protein EI90DRAFT_3014731 [Cantharellus anzutake]KAF8334875.1 hypothetical protein EI90DRAFT_3014731 [Cantharellus anzutake]
MSRLNAGEQWWELRMEHDVTTAYHEGNVTRWEEPMKDACIECIRMEERDEHWGRWKDVLRTEVVTAERREDAEGQMRPLRRHCQWRWTGWGKRSTTDEAAERWECCRMPIRWTLNASVHERGLNI